MSRAVPALGAAATCVALAVSLARRHRLRAEHVVRAYYGAWGRGDADAMRDLLADGYRAHMHTLAGTEERGADELASLVRSHAKAFEHVEYEVRDVLGADGRAAARVTMRARHRESGREGEIDGVAIFRLARGRLAEEWSSWDYLGLAEQLGLAAVS
jgi:steroid delta-isomerase-like uncharacterized protein